MELIERINGMEGEVKVIKAEIKNVLIDLRELMNNYENPFINVEQLSGVKEREKEVIRAEREKKDKEHEVVRDDKEEELPTVREYPQLQPESESEPEITAPEFTTKRDTEKDREERKKLEHAHLKVEKVDIFKLTQLMKWADISLSNIGKDKLNELIDLYELTGRLPKETKDIISRIEDLSSINSAPVGDDIEIKDCILALYQLDRIVTGETAAQAPIMLSEDELAKWLKV